MWDWHFNFSTGSATVVQVESRQAIHQFLLSLFVQANSIYISFNYLHQSTFVYLFYWSSIISSICPSKLPHFHVGKAETTSMSRAGIIPLRALPVEKRRQTPPVGFADSRLSMGYIYLSNTGHDRTYTCGWHILFIAFTYTIACDCIYFQ